MSGKPVVLIVRDGWGRNPNPEHDAFNAREIGQPRPGAMRCWPSTRTR